jgi:hypothetical protein
MKRIFCIAVAILIMTADADLAQSAPNDGCVFSHAEYVPSFPRPTYSSYDYKITIQENPARYGAADPLRGFFVLDVIDHKSGKLETQFKMDYYIAASDLVAASLELAHWTDASGRHATIITPVFLNMDFQSKIALELNDAASYAIVLPQAYAKFHRVSWEGIEPSKLKYFSAKNINPGQSEGEHLIFIPDVWVFSGCNIHQLL